MNSVNLTDVTNYLDGLLDTAGTPDYPNALNGLQLSSTGTVTKVAAAVDFSSATVTSAIAEKADLLIVHHGMFWSGLEPVRGASFDRLKLLLDNDVGVYASHLPLDRHPEFGNNALLAAELGLKPSSGFARFQSIDIGVRGDSDIATEELAARAAAFAAKHGGALRTTTIEPGRRTRRWAMCTGSGASADTLREAADYGIDTLIVGEGAHWTAVHATDSGIVILYAGHYATETVGVAALARHVGDKFSIPSTFIDHPTGL